METGLRGRRALVTASSKGLGFASARALATEGCRIVISSSNAKNLEAATQALNKEGHEVQERVADLRKSDQCAELIEWAITTLGALDVLVNNTRGPIFGTVEDLDDTASRDAFDLVLMSAVRLSRAALPALRRDRGGAIVNLTSIAAHQPVDNLVLSNALRPAVVAMGKTLAKEALRDRPHHRGEPASSLKAWRKCRRDPRQELQTDSARTIRPARRAGGGRRVPRGRRLELHHGHHTLSGRRRVPGPFLGQRFVSGHFPGKGFTLGAFSQSARIGA